MLTSARSPCAPIDFAAVDRLRFVAAADDDLGAAFLQLFRDFESDS